MIKRTLQINAQRRFDKFLGLVHQINAASFMDGGEDDGKEPITAINASSMVQGSFNQPLTTYATGWAMDAGESLNAELAFWAPAVEAPGRLFQYAENINWEAFLSDGSADDLRASGAEFKSVNYNTKKTLGKVHNRGLQMVVDLDDVKEERNWQQKRVARLMRRLKMNKLRRAIALLTAADVNTGKTWDNSEGKDPDMDVIAELVTAADTVGMKPNRVGYGDTAWSKRLVSHRAQNTAGGITSASMTPQTLAGLLGVESVHHSESRYTATTTTKNQVLGALVMMFTALQNADEEDPSNVKDFWFPTDQGVQFGVHSIPWGVKKWIIAVEHNELLALTSNLGIRSLTIN